MTTELIDDVSKDAEFTDAFKHSDRQNAKITFDKVLGQKMADYVTSHFEVFSMFNDNAEFRKDYSLFMFEQIERALVRPR
jgi:type I restriction enzyme R subunit